MFCFCLLAFFCLLFGVRCLFFIWFFGLLSFGFSQVVFLVFFSRVFSFGLFLFFYCFLSFAFFLFVQIFFVFYGFLFLIFQFLFSNLFF